MNKNKIEDWTNQVHQGDAVETLSEMPESSVHMIVFSPPYYGQRDYNNENQIGLEDSVDKYIKEMVDVGNEIQRVLREDGTFWLNIGDTYQTSKGVPGGSNAKHSDKKVNDSARRFGLRPQDTSSDKFQRKDKMLIPHRVAIALQESGWIVRNDAVWKKTNPMPDPTNDRLETTFENIYLFVQNQKYYFNGEYDSRRGRGDVIETPTASFGDNHFAVFPIDMCEEMIERGCPDKVCKECGTPYEYNQEKSQREKQCDCSTQETGSGIVYDPFVGSGTTCVVAENLGRCWIGSDINSDYVEVAEKRVEEETGILQNDALEY